MFKQNIGRAQRSIGRAQMNIGRAWALPGLYKTTPLPLGAGGKSWRRGPNLPPFSSFSTDLGHFVLKLLNFDIYFLFYVNFLVF